ncbi:MAG: AlpA family phage regulatory protein [Pseudomonadota bacterium]
MHQPAATPLTGSTERPNELLIPAYFRMRDLLHITGLSRPTLYRRIATRRFPPPVRLGGRACGWPRAALQAWIADPDGYRAPQTVANSLPRKPGRPPKYPA